MPRRTPHLVLHAIALAALACSLTPGVFEDAAGTNPVSTPAAPSPTPDGPAPPTSFDDVLLAEVEAGARYEDALIALLRSFLGEGVDDLPQGHEQVLTREGNAITERAHEYLEFGTDEAAKDEIERLLGLLVPSAEALEAYSIPEEEAARAPGVSRPRAQEDCADLWRRGFPLGGSYPCFVHRIIGVPGGGAVGIYYPAAWSADDPRRAYLEAASEASIAALDRYRTYGDSGPISLIFSLVQGTPDFLAETFSRHFQEGESCPILIYPSAYSSGDLPADEAMGYFRQTVAHEIFHCFQVRQFPGQMLGVSRGDRMWWSEATAEYFANTVYPRVNFEFRLAGAFDDGSPIYAANELGYANAIFFQFLASEIGDADLIELLRSMPESGGADAQLEALAGFPGIADLYHRFGQAYLDGRIGDSGGSNWPTSPSIPFDEGGLHYPGDSGIPATADPFVLVRSGVDFEPHRLYEITTAEADGPGLASLKIGAAAWGEFPPWINTGCPIERMVLLTTTAATGGDYKFTATTEVDEEDTGCDRCLLGTWALDLDSYRLAFDSVFSSLGASATLLDVSGEMIGEYHRSGQTEGWMNLVTSVRVEPPDDDPYTMEVRMTGSGLSAYSVTNDGRILGRPISEAFEAVVTIERHGMRVETPLASMEPPALVNGTYVCEGDRLHITPLDVGVDHPGLDYRRVSD